jgi:RNAse (barnase) inhibitor barstar
MQKLQIILDGNNFSTLEGFYNEVDKIFTRDLTWDTGHNLDAFNDILRGGFGVHEYGEPLDLIWKNSSKSRDDLGYIETIKDWERKLTRCHPENVEIVKNYLKLAKEHQGETLFDTIVEIIKLHDHIDLKLS